jgi:hypothetical protein
MSEMKTVEAKVPCQRCGAQVSKRNLSSHMKTIKCSNFGKSEEHLRLERDIAMNKKKELNKIKSNFEPEEKKLRRVQKIQFEDNGNLTEDEEVDEEDEDEEDEDENMLYDMNDTIEEVYAGLEKLAMVMLEVRDKVNLIESKMK